MKLVRVDYIPEAVYRNSKNDIAQLLEDFLASDMKYARVEWNTDNYCRAESVRQTLAQTIKNAKLPITLHTRRGEIYIARKG